MNQQNNSSPIATAHWETSWLANESAHEPACARMMSATRSWSARLERRSVARALMAAILAAAPVAHALAASNKEPELVEAAIPFVNQGGIRDWHADKDRGLWVQGTNRRWYYATFKGRCDGLRWATYLGFDTRFQNSFDRWSSVVVPGYGRCPVNTFTRSDGPPRKTKPTVVEEEAPASTTG